MADAASGIATGIVAGAAVGAAVGATVGLVALVGGTIQGAFATAATYNPYGTYAVGSPASYVGSGVVGGGGGTDANGTPLNSYTGKPTFASQLMSVMYYRDIPRVKALSVAAQITEHGYSYVKAKPVGGAQYDNVRRPMRGIQIKEDTYALLTIETADGTKIFETPNTSAPGGHGSPYSNFILTNASERIEEKFAILETFGEDFAFFMGAKAKIYEFSGILMNTEDFPWKAEWLSNYQGFFRGSRTAERRARTVLEFDQEVLRGFLIGTQIQNNANKSYQCDFSFTMVVLDHYSLEDVSMTEYPHYNIPHGFVFESEYYSNNYESLTFQTRKALLGLDNGTPQFADPMAFLNVDQLYYMAAGALYNYPAIVNNILSYQMQNVLYGRVMRTPQGGMSVDDIDPGYAQYSYNSIRQSSGGMASGLAGALASLASGDAGGNYSIQDLMKPMWTSSLMTSVFSSLVPMNVAKLIAGNWTLGTSGTNTMGIGMSQIYGPIRFNYDEYPGRVPLGGFDGISTEYLKNISKQYDVAMFGLAYDNGWQYNPPTEGNEANEPATVTWGTSGAKASSSFANLAQAAAQKPEAELDATMLLEVLLHGEIVSAGAGFAKINKISTVWSAGLQMVRRMWGDAQVNPNSSIIKLVSEVGSWGEYAAEVSADALHLWWNMTADGVNLKVRTVDEPSVYRKGSLQDYAGAYTYKAKAPTEVQLTTSGQMSVRQSLNEETAVGTQSVGLAKFGQNLDKITKPWNPDKVTPYVKAFTIDDGSDVLPPVIKNTANYYSNELDIYSPDVTTLNSSTQFFAEESFTGELTLLSSKTVFTTEDGGASATVWVGTSTVPVSEDTAPDAAGLQGNMALFFNEASPPDAVPAYSPYEG